MDLFSSDSRENLLPYDGTVNYFGTVMTQQEANHYFAVLLATIEWRNDEAVLFGKKIITKRKVAWYGDAGYDYTYSNITKRALNWTRELLALKKLVEQLTGATFNSCLLNLYHDGNESVSWHSDGEKTLAKNGAIASLSFGAARRFDFRHKSTAEKRSFLLEHGSLLVMKDATQSNWLHALPKSAKVMHPRINLTFRTMVVPTAP